MRRGKSFCDELQEAGFLSNSQRLNELIWLTGVKPVKDTAPVRPYFRLISGHAPETLIVACKSYLAKFQSSQTLESRGDKNIFVFLTKMPSFFTVVKTLKLQCPMACLCCYAGKLPLFLFTNLFFYWLWNFIIS